LLKEFIAATDKVARKFQPFSAPEKA